MLRLVDSSSTKDKPPEEKYHSAPDQKAQQEFPPISDCFKKIGFKRYLFFL